MDKGNKGYIYIYIIAVFVYKLLSCVYHSVIIKEGCNALRSIYTSYHYIRRIIYDTSTKKESTRYFYVYIILFYENNESFVLLSFYHYAFYHPIHSNVFISFDLLSSLLVFLFFSFSFLFLFPLLLVLLLV